MGAFLIGVSYWVSTTELKAAFKPADKVEEKEETVIGDSESTVDKGGELTDFHTVIDEGKETKQIDSNKIKGEVKAKERAAQPQEGRPELKNVPGWKSESERLNNNE